MKLAKHSKLPKEHNWTQFVSIACPYNLVTGREGGLSPCIDQKSQFIPGSRLQEVFLRGNRVKKGEGETIRSKTDNRGMRFYYRDLILWLKGYETSRKRRKYAAIAYAGL